MSCYLIPLITGLGAAVLGGIIAWLMRNKPFSMLESKYAELYTDFHQKDLQYSELEKYHSSALGDINKLTEQQETLINHHRELKAKYDVLHLAQEDTLQREKNIQSQLAAQVAQYNELRQTFRATLSEKETLTLQYNKELAELKESLNAKPKEVEKIVEVPVEVIREVERIVEVPVEVIREIEKPVEVIREVEKIVEVPVEVIREIEKPVEVIREIERIVEVPVEVIREIEKPVEVIREVERIVEVPASALKSRAVKKTTSGIAPEINSEKKKAVSSTSQASSSKGRRKVLVEITPQAPVKVPKDDLTNIEGIGPAIAKVLNKAGIINYAQLAKTSVSKIQKIMDSGGTRFRMHDPGSWPKQADLLAKGKLKEFKALTDRLKGGR